MPDMHGGGPIPPITAAEITDEIWLEVARQHSGGAPLREAAEKARLASSPTAAPRAAPVPLPLPALLELNGPAFVEAAYATLLGRAADPVGMALYEAELARGRTKIELLGRLQASGEARQSGRTLPGLRRRYLAHRLYRIPLLGPLARVGGVALRRAGVSRALGGRGKADVALRAELESRLGVFTAAIDSRRRVLEEKLAEQRTAVELATRRLAQVQAAQDELGRRALSAIADQGRLLATLSDQSAGFARQLAATEDSVIESLLSLHDSVTGQAKRLSRLEGSFDPAAAKQRIEAAAGALRAELDGRVIAAEAVAAQNKRDVADQQRRIGLMLHTLRHPAAPGLDRASDRVLETEDDHALDALYVSFEDTFRGGRTAIKDRQRVYLQRLRLAGENAPGCPVLDIGAGRGEFLELLREEGIPALGVDANETMVAECRDAGLDCAQGDALSFLAGRPDASLAAVTGFHIVEHLPFKVVVRVIDEALRALAPGGLLVLETPNPANILTASRYFYLDPTHRNPLPSEMMVMIAEARGFTSPDILQLHPMDERFPGSDRQLAESLDAIFHGPQDYALVAWKA